MPQVNQRRCCYGGVSYMSSPDCSRCWLDSSSRSISGTYMDWWHTQRTTHMQMFGTYTSGQLVCVVSGQIHDCTLAGLNLLIPGVMVNPALMEPFGLTLLEAAHCGLPVRSCYDGEAVLRDAVGCRYRLWWACRHCERSLKWVDCECE